MKVTGMIRRFDDLGRIVIPKDIRRIIFSKEFMYNQNNQFKCKGCPENKGYNMSNPDQHPCGQYRCWVTVHIK